MPDLILPEDLPDGVTSVEVSVQRTAQTGGRPALVMQHPSGYIIFTDPRDVHRLADVLHHQADELAKAVARDYR